MMVAHQMAQLRGVASPRQSMRLEAAAAFAGVAARRRRTELVRCAAARDPQRSSSSSSSSAAAPSLPEVDWSRYHLQVLFIDANDVLRARLAAALFERVAEWNGYGRVLLPFTCGTDADQGGSAGGLATQAALMYRARSLGLRPKAFTRPTDRFEPADLDRHDVVVAVDRRTKEAVLRLVDPRYVAYYDAEVRLLSEYAAFEAATHGDARLLRQGGLALLPRDYSTALAARRGGGENGGENGGSGGLLGGGGGGENGGGGGGENGGGGGWADDVPRPDLLDAGAGAEADFEAMVRSLMVGCAGLASYLIDSYPDDLPEYDPL